MDIGDVVKELQLIRDILLASHAIHSSISGHARVSYVNILLLVDRCLSFLGFRSLRFEGSSSRFVTSNWQNFTSFRLP
ncbi:hypothetical protein MTR67_001864 [Solanum verrucosum]|uniref:Uncharacterized protein n=1 Tax=Solanum verrucosum TaxID=315347 RepID=A0AAF0PV36_SOLVR|nr:hypothetical protein MTR67_001864 [Solanum verrucosum]